MPSGPRASREPLVGRAREVERLGLQLDAVEHGAPRVVTLTGEPGIGKTRLLRELLESAAGRGAIALDGRAAEFERDVPFGVWIDALDARAAALDRGRLNRLADDRRAELAAMLPGLADLGPGRADPPAGGY